MQSIRVDKPDWLAPSHIKAFTTTVYGGVSHGVYGSLNLGSHVGDDLNLVKENRARVKVSEALPNDPVWLNQVHGTEVVQLLDTPVQSNDVITADGAFTNDKGVVCAIMTADCLPLFLTNRAGDRVAMLHAGWRSLADGIIEEGVRALNCSVDDVIAWAGPSIGPSAFEIGDEVRQQLGGPAEAYKPSPNSLSSKLKWFGNLYQLAGQRLSDVGVRYYSHSNVCTYSDERYFSYRRTGQCGRMASFIWIDN